jgi:hypothetical protein
MVDPNMTKFRAMSLEKQVTTIEKLGQEALRAREEMLATEASILQVATETTKIPQVALVQGRGTPMDQDARERGLLMLDHAQWIIYQL